MGFLNWIFSRVPVLVIFVGFYGCLEVNETTVAPGEEIADGISVNLESLRHLCYAQCHALCIDSQLQDCDTRCAYFKVNMEWAERCRNDNECLTACSYLRNDTGGDKFHPEVPQVILIQLNSRWIKLEWSPLAQNTGAIYYVIESAYQGQNWQFLHQTEDTSYSSELGVCEKKRYRVASVNQYGTKRYHHSSVVYRYVLPKPPVVTFRADPFIAFDEFQGYFYITLYWDQPTGWAADDLDRYVMFDHMEKTCSPDNIMPPVPYVSSISQLSNVPIIEANVDIHKLGKGCIYNTTVKAVSTCGLYGKPAELSIDLTDCETIVGIECDDTKYDPPGKVLNTTLELVNQTLCVLMEWLPPEDMGSEGRIDFYDIQWGVNPEKAVTDVLEEVGRTSVPSKKTTFEICVNMTNITYGVKVMPRVNGTHGRTFDIDVWQTDTEFCIDELKESSGNSPPTPGNGEDSNTPLLNGPSGMALLAVLSVVAISTVSAFLIIFHKRHVNRKRRELGAQNLYKLDPALGAEIKHPVTNPLYISSDPWEIPRKRLVLGPALGKGAFGQVVLGELSFPRPLAPPPPPPYNQHHNDGSEGSDEIYVSPNSETILKVAVKMLHDSSDATLVVDFLQEIVLMKSIGAHPHIVSILGCCTLADPLCLIVEHMPKGDLLHFLRNSRHSLRDESVMEEERLNIKDLLSFARQVTVGMEFLSQRGFVHRDLATRNVLVGSDKTVKIGDFGLTRYIYDDHIYVMKRGRSLPLKWMAIEAIFDLVFNTQTDVWSFGVVLYELITLGGVPYPTVPNGGLLKKLQSGYRMERPDNCPAQLYSMMLACWEENPGLRPSFTSLRENLENMIADLSSAHYVTICVDETKPCYNHALDEENDDGDELPTPNTKEEINPQDACETLGILPEENELTNDDVFDDSSTWSHCATPHLNDTRPTGEARTWMSTSSGIFSDHPMPSPQDESSSGSGQFLFPPKSQLSVPQGSRPARRRMDQFRVSTCSQDKLLTSSISEGFASDDASSSLSTSF